MYYLIIYNNDGKVIYKLYKDTRFCLKHIKSAKYINNVKVIKYTKECYDTNVNPCTTK